jgi:hypothetical protein
MAPHFGGTAMTNPNDQALPGNGAPGLTKREYFAAAALAGLVADGIPKTDVAQFAVIVADSLIDALNAPQP